MNFAAGESASDEEADGRQERGEEGEEEAVKKEKKDKKNDAAKKPKKKKTSSSSSSESELQISAAWRDRRPPKGSKQNSQNDTTNKPQLQIEN